MSQKKTIPIAVLGASGYVGGQLLTLLANHPQVRIAAATANRQAGQRAVDIFPALGSFGNIPLSTLDPHTVAQEAEIVLSALPHGESAQVLGDIARAGARVIDLSADYRFSNPKVYASTYGHAHPCPDLAESAVYGLVEFERERIPGAHIVGVPGCYPTATLLALLPLLTGGFTKLSAGVIVDAKSGVSGAGRDAKTDNLFCEVDGGVRAYNVGRHRHQPEMRFHAERIGLAGAGQIDLFFTPQVVPMSRGILASVYVRPKDGFVVDLDLVRSHFEKTYADSPFGTVLPEGSFPNTRQVTGTNRFQVALAGGEEERRLVALCAIDNLIKGAAGQGIQCMNLMLGLPEMTALPLVGTIA
ncbi:MAG: N-acetyl-gamma-glutamyl-phosphate reductase [Nitrospirota bacterium]|nr:N-acetyl-gamma-glutamyl-phosphate reductase [Nitrospirota bacterium]